MNEMIQIQGTSILLKEYQGKRVVTFKDVDLVHKRPEGTARKRFNDNRKRFVSGVDFFKAPYKEVIERPLEGRSILEVVDNIEGYRGMDYSGYIFIAKDAESGFIKIGRTTHKESRIKNLKGNRLIALSDFEWFDCLDTLKAIKLVYMELSSFCYKDSWYNCSKEQAAKCITEAVAIINENYEPREYHKGGYHGDLTLITETGYLMLVKSFTDELAWKVQRELVDSYFNKKELDKPEEPKSEQPVPIEHDPSIYIQAAQIAAGLPGGYIYSINCLRHIVPDIDVEPVQEEVTVKEEVKTTVKTTQRGNPKFFKVGVPCDTVKLRKTMNQRNLSISRMARLSEVSTTTVKNILDGKHNPTVETRTKFCKALKVSEDYLTPVTEAK